MSWVMLVLGSLVGGLSLVALMMVPRKLIFPFAATVMAGVIASFAGLFAVAMDAGRIDIGIVSGLIGFLLFGLAYSIGTALAPRFLVSGSQNPIAVSGSRSGCAAVILTTCVEPTRYSPRAFALHLAEFDATSVPLPPWSARPMLFAAERARYQAAGGSSPARTTCRGIAADLDAILKDETRCNVVGTAWCTSTPSLADAVASAVADGADHVVVVQHAIAETLRADRARSAVDTLTPAQHGISITYTPPLWGSKVLMDRVVERVVAAMGDRTPSSVGVCLVGHGQPREWHAKHPSWTEQETYFHQRIRAHLDDHGIQPENVKLAWLDWAEPDVTETVRHIAALGNRLVIVVPASMPVDTLSTLVDLRQAVALARVPESAEVVILDPWGRDPAVTHELAARVRAVLDER